MLPGGPVSAYRKLLAQVQHDCGWVCAEASLVFDGSLHNHLRSIDHMNDHMVLVIMQIYQGGNHSHCRHVKSDVSEAQL